MHEDDGRAVLGSMELVVKPHAIAVELHLAVRLRKMAGRAVHERTGKVLAEELEFPRTFFGRGIGLMFRRTLEPGRGMWINPCNGIHMMFMNFPSTPFSSTARSG